MGFPRLDHAGAVVDDLDAATAFFLELGFEREGGGQVEGEWVDEVVGLAGVRAEFEMLRTPDRNGKLELIRFHAPANRLGFRHIAIEVEDLNTTVDGLRDDGFDTVGEVRDFEDTYRLCYIRGPEGLIVELAEQIPSS